MKIRILTSCTGEKRHSLANQLTQADFQLLSQPDVFTRRESELDAYRTAAGDLYTGQQHVRLMRGVKAYQQKLGKESIDLWILSAGYGLIPAERTIVPYECTFQGMKPAEIRRWADHLAIPQSARKVFALPADLTIVLLGDGYLQALALDEKVQFSGPTLFFTSTQAQKRVAGQGQLRLIPLTNADAKRFHCGLVGLKGELARRLLEVLLPEKPGTLTISDLFKSDVDILAKLDSAVETAPIPVKKAEARPNPKVDQVIDIPESWWQKPHRAKLRYFIPDWDDYVDPEYDFETDTQSGERGTWSNQVYSHQLYPEPSYDGILVSRAVIDKKRQKSQQINSLGIHRYLRVPDQFQILGDCGAFDYITQDTPPYSNEDVIDYYTRLGFNLGVSVDHIILAGTESKKKYRYELTIHNAEEFLKEHKARGLSWIPIGAVQGWDPQSYADAAKCYIKMGYRYIALGGLVRSNTNEIFRILQAVHEVVPSDIQMHLFGIARFQAVPEFIKYGVTSIDSASMLRTAWLGSNRNYLTCDGWYSAIRIPQTDGSFRAKKAVQEGKILIDELRRLEKSCLDGLRDYASNPTRLNPALLDHLIAYDTLIAGERSGTRDRIFKTLSERPWSQCECAICKKWGIEVVIFRGNNRNRRRGFHNTHIFYQLMQKIVEGEKIPWLEPDEDTKTVQLELFQNP